MSEHKAFLQWQLTDGEDFLKGRYSREHAWTFDGGCSVPASASPSVVPLPMSNPANVDPEEAFVAAIASCHMLSFLYVASRKGFAVRSYEDAAVGTMSKNERGVLWISNVVLNPRIEYHGGRAPTREEVDSLHHEAHGQCFIANSVKTEVTVNTAD
ncbi:MAG: OsmC family protein [Gammaproteobacteria bacterium]|nr:OsmC family protein [Gammaproteobacteria bacterium]